jgi:hypothetical protein
MQFYGISFKHPYTQSGPEIEQTAYTDACKNTIKLHVPVFLRMNTWMVKIC